MAKSNKKDNGEKELDVMLAQLKQKIGSESETVSELEEGEEDQDLIAMLKQVFEVPDEEKHASLLDTSGFEIDVATDLPEDNDAKEESSAVIETGVEVLTPDEDEVDGVLDVMFGSKTASLSDEVEVEEEFDDDEQDLTIGELEERLEREQAELAEEEFDNNNNEEDLTIKEPEESFNEEMPVDEGFESEEKKSILFPSFPMTDEEAEEVSMADSDETVREKELSESEDMSNPSYRRMQAAEPLEESVSQKITDPSQYIFDPLQAMLPCFKLGGKKAIEEQQPERSKSVAEEEKVSLDSRDVSLLLKFGYDDEVKSKIGEEETRKVLFEKDSHFVPEAHQRPFGFCGKELTDCSQIPEIKERYRADKRSLIIRLVICGFISLMIFVVDLFFEFFSDRSSYPIVLGFEFFLVAIMGLVIYKKIYSGFVGLLRMEAGRYSLPVFIMAMYGLFDIICLILYFVDSGAYDTSDLMLFGFAISMYILLTLAADLISCTKEASAFDIVTSSDALYAVEKQQSLQYGNRSETEEISEDSHTEEHTYKKSENAYQIRKTTLISGYFKKTTRDKSGSVNLIYILGVVPVSALIVGCICAITGDNIIRGVSAMMMTFLLCIPFSYVFLSTASEYIMAWHLKKRHHAAFIDYEAVNMYARTESLTFKDTDAVEVVAYTEIHPSKSTDSKNHLSIAYDVLKALGGPLGRSVPSANEACENPILINSIASNGINLIYNSSVNILIGDRSYMNAYQIKVKTDSSLTAAVKGAERSVLYMAFDGAPKLGFIVNSKIRAEFAKTVALLDENNIRVLVESYEPQINTSYFEQNFQQKLGVETVYKPSSFASAECLDICDGGIVCSSNAQDAARAMTLCKPIIEKRRQTGHLHMALVAGEALFAVLFAILMNVASSFAPLEWMQEHISFLFHVLMFLGMVPSIISLYRLKKQDSGDLKQNE